MNVIIIAVLIRSQVIVSAPIAPFNQLPPDTLRRISEGLLPNDLNKFRLVNRKTKRAADHGSLQIDKIITIIPKINNQNIDQDDYYKLAIKSFLPPWITIQPVFTQEFDRKTPEILDIFKNIHYSQLSFINKCKIMHWLNLFAPIYDAFESKTWFPDSFTRVVQDTPLYSSFNEIKCDNPHDVAISLYYLGLYEHINNKLEIRDKLIELLQSDNMGFDQEEFPPFQLQYPLQNVMYYQMHAQRRPLFCKWEDFPLRQFAEIVNQRTGLNMDLDNWSVDVTLIWVSSLIAGMLCCSVLGYVLCTHNRRHTRQIILPTVETKEEEFGDTDNFDDEK